METERECDAEDTLLFSLDPLSATSPIPAKDCNLTFLCCGYANPLTLRNFLGISYYPVLGSTLWAFCKHGQIPNFGLIDLLL